jgi:GT2 family glycosyltransferase
MAADYSARPVKRPTPDSFTKQNSMPSMKKAWHIFRTYGFAELAYRAAQSIQRERAARRDAAAQRRAWSKLLADIGDPKPLVFPHYEHPLISIVIPVHNNVRFTGACLHAVLQALDVIPSEVIVVDDASTDGTRAYLESCSGLTIVEHASNQGFVQSVNEGAKAARGRYLLLLNNDTIVTPGWSAALLRVFESDDRVGAAGSQLQTPDGSISEAGAVVFADGNAANFGRGRNPEDPGVAFPREVDYCSAASLMVPSELFRSLGGFSAEFAPAYYEDADLCFRLRAAGYRVLYEPDSVVVHLEGGTAGTDPSAGMKRYQHVHRNVFATKWAAALAEHFPAEPASVERAARRLAGTRTILVIDSFVPFDDRSAGARRLLAIMELMRELDAHVIFIADDGGKYEPYTTRLRRRGVEVIPHGGDITAVLQTIAVPIDMAWISRADLMQKYGSLLRASYGAKIVYDTVDLHFVRMQREEAITGRPTGWQEMQSIELQLSQEADRTVVTGAEERLILSEHGVDADVVPIIESTVPAQASFAEREHILFLGNYSHGPNVDAAEWLARRVMPLVWERIPAARLVLAGSDPTPPVRRLAADRVSVPGFVPDVRPLFEEARVFAAALRFGAGMKGKVVLSLAHGLPVVTTPVGAEGISLVDGVNALIRRDEAEFANALVQLYTEEALWSEIAAGGREAAGRFTPRAVKPLLQQVLDRASGGKEPHARSR